MRTLSVTFLALLALTLSGCKNPVDSGDECNLTEVLVSAQAYIDSIWQDSLPLTVREYDAVIAEGVTGQRMQVEFCEQACIWMGYADAPMTQDGYSISVIDSVEYVHIQKQINTASADVLHTVHLNHYLHMESANCTVEDYRFELDEWTLNGTYEYTDQIIAVLEGRFLTFQDELQEWIFQEPSERISLNGTSAYVHGDVDVTYTIDDFEITPSSTDLTITWNNALTRRNIACR